MALGQTGSGAATADRRAGIPVRNRHRRRDRTPGGSAVGAWKLSAWSFNGWNFGARILGAWALSLLLATGAAQAVSFTTSNNYKLDLPELSEIRGDCVKIRQVLNMIDATGYRKGPTPSDPADWPLFEYEKALSLMIVDCSRQGAEARPSQFLQGVPIRGLH